MSPDEFPAQADALCRTCRRFGERQWCLATSGNFSARLDEAHCLITQSGREKSRLTRDDLMVCRLDGSALDKSLRPSAETPLHTMLYGLDAGIGAVLHTHSVTSTVLSRRAGSMLRISGFEMQKALPGIDSHEASLAVRIFDNDQDMPALAAKVAAAYKRDGFRVPGFLIRGHGLTAWGADVASAERHVEGLEFLFQCLWQEALAGSA